MKVLIVDDNKSMLNLLGFVLQKEKFSIEQVMDGRTAFEKAQKNKYDLIILDMILPEENGFFVISALRTLGNNTPILAISAETSLNVRVKALNMGADDFLVKEFALEELLARVKSLLRRESGKRTNIFKSKGLVLNLSDMTVQYKGDLIKLTKKEFQMLLLFLRNKGEVVTRKNLIDALWNGVENSNISNTIDSHMRALRKKLGEAGKLIETVRASGYIIRS